MIILQSLLPTRTVLCTCLLLAALSVCGLARSQEVLIPDAQPTALSQIKEFTNHASELVMRAIGLLGIRYKLGGNSPESGLDCSGFVNYVYKEAWGTTLPRTAEELSKVGQQVAPQDLQAGDLVFYNTLKRGFSHVGIYLGDNRFIHAPATGGQVRIESMDIAYWKTRFSGARRVNDPEQK